MKLSDISRFNIESTPHQTGGMSVTLFVLDDKMVGPGQQKSLHTINVVSSGKNETDATQKGIQKCIDRLNKLNSLSDIVRFGVLNLTGDNKTGFVCQVQLGLFDKGNELGDPTVKKTLGFGKGKDIESAQLSALDSALEIIGEK